MKQLDLEWLRTFKVFSESRNINEAANALNLSQPAVSVHLKSLEQSFHKKLFQSVGRKKELTPFGKEMYTFLKDAFENLEKGLRKLELAHEDLENDLIRIGGRKEIVEKILMINDFKGRLQIFESDTESALLSLKQRKIELAFSVHTEVGSDIIAKPVLTQRPQLIFHKKFLKGYSVDKIFSNRKFFEETPCLFYKEVPPYLNQIYRSNKIDFRKLNPKIIIDNWNIITKFACDGQGYAIVPNAFDLPSSVIQIEVPKKLEEAVTIYALYHTDYRDNKLIKEFISSLSKV